MRVLAALAFLAAGIISRPAAAQTNFALRDLTRGVTSPTESGVAGDYDATAVGLNPAGLAMLGAPSVSFTATDLGSERTLVGGGGWGLAIGLPLRLPFLPLTYAYGFGYQGLDSPDSWRGPILGSEDSDGSYLLNSVAVGNDRLSVGYTIGTFYWADTPQRDSVLTHHIGISFRPSRYVAFGATVRDVFEPVGRAPEEKFTRSYETELMFRPFGDWRVEFGGGALIGEDELVDGRGRLVLRLLRGVTAFAQYESVARHFDAADARATRDNRVLAGITLSGIDGLLGSGDTSLAVSYGVRASTKSPKTYGGSSVALRWSAERYPAIIERKRIEKVALDRDLSDRAFVRELLHLEELARADDVAGVVLTIGSTSLGWGRTEELREAIYLLRGRGKKVLAYLRTGGMRAYYLASSCDRILLHPTTSLQLTGVASQMVYFKDLLDDVGIGAQVLKIAEYKSAGEPFSRTSASPAARHELEVFLRDLTRLFTSNVAAERKLDEAELRKILAQTSITAARAHALGLVDDLAHPDEIKEATKKLFGRSVSITAPSKRVRRAKQWAFPRIAIIYVEDEILPGPAEPSLFSQAPTGDVIARAIAEARESSSIEAIVLRVNSPGGAVLPSEEIARQVELTRGKKPIIVSMGDVAASGGYMAAAYGDEIYAPLAALTGSIGILAVKLDIGDLMAKLGLSSETFKTGPHADADSIFRPWSAEETDARQKELTYLYDRFVGLVSAGRGLADDKVREVARGRIWSGHRALGNGLIDHRGSVLDAIHEARRLAGICPGTAIRAVHWPTSLGGAIEKLAGAAGQGKVWKALPKSLRRTLRAVPAVLFTDSRELALLPWLVLD